MAGSVKPGPRDQLVTQSLEQAIAGLDTELIDVAALDPAEGPERLARHAMEELRRVLTDADLGADQQATSVNEILASVGTGIDAIAVPAHVLRGIRSRSTLGDVVPLPSTFGRTRISTACSRR